MSVSVVGVMMRTAPCKDRDPRIFVHFAVHCLNCDSYERSFGNIKYHIARECPMAGLVHVYCGCCGAVYRRLSTLASHLNRLGVHRQHSTVPGYDMKVPPPQPPALSSLALPVIESYCSTSPRASGKKTTGPRASGTSAATSSSTTTQATISVPASTSAVAHPSNCSLTSAIVGENQRLRGLVCTLCLHLVWLSSIISRMPDFSRPDTVNQLTLSPPSQLPHSSDVSFRQMLSASPIWPADSPDITSASIHSLLQRLVPLYSSCAFQPPLD